MIDEEEDSGQRELARAMVHVLASEDGRRVMFWLLGLCGLYEDGFTGEDNLTNYRLGRQSVAKQIIAMMNMIDGGLYPRLLLQMAAIRESEETQERQLQDE